MRLARGLLVLAIVAALLGAPSSLSAAVNELSSPQVSPGTGSVTTVFTFRVRYDGRFSAATVSVTVAGLTVPMALESGSLTAGWWSGSSALPVGSWSTSFRATSVRGPDATIAGPGVTVAGPATPPPSTAEQTSPTTGATPESAPVGPVDPTAAPAAPAPPPEETAATAGAEATPAPVSAAMPEPGETGDARAADGAPAASLASDPIPTGGMTRMLPAADGTSRDERAATDALESDVLLLGLAGVASVAIAGTLLLAAGRRRKPEQAPAIAAPSVVEDAAPRRIARSGRGRATGDPIVAALGVDDEMAARRAIRRAQREAPGEDRHPARRLRGR